MTPLCVYHAPCADGFTAAWAVWRKHPNWEFCGAAHGNPPPDVTGRDVYLVDFSYPRATLEQMAQQARSVTVLDHHVSAQKDLQPLMNAGVIDGVFDMARSGARIAWDWFHPGEPPPRLLLHVEDRDLWRFALPGTREIQAALFAESYAFDRWDHLMLHADLNRLASDGEAIMRKQMKDINEFIGVAGRRMVIAGHDVPVLNAPYFWSSEAGHIMAQGEAFAACYWDQDDKRVFSLRSASEGVDVSEIASQYGGGGHANAAGFRAAIGWDGERPAG